MPERPWNSGRAIFVIGSGNGVAWIISLAFLSFSRSVAISFDRWRNRSLPVLPRITFGSFPRTPTNWRTVVKSRLLFERTRLTVSATLESLTRISLMVIVSFSNVETGTAVSLPSFVSNLRRQTADSPLERTSARIQLPVSSGAAAGEYGG